MHGTAAPADLHPVRAGCHVVQHQVGQVGTRRPDIRSDRRLVLDDQHRGRCPLTRHRHPADHGPPCRGTPPPAGASARSVPPPCRLPGASASGAWRSRPHWKRTRLRMGQLASTCRRRDTPPYRRQHVHTGQGEGRHRSWPPRRGAPLPSHRDRTAGPPGHCRRGSPFRLAVASVTSTVSAEMHSRPGGYPAVVHADGARVRPRACRAVTRTDREQRAVLLSGDVGQARHARIESYMALMEEQGWRRAVTRADRERCACRPAQGVLCSAYPVGSHADKCWRRGAVQRCSRQQTTIAGRQRRARKRSGCSCEDMLDGQPAAPYSALPSDV